MELIEKIKQKIAEDSAFADALKAAKTPEDVLNTLLEAGLDVTREDVMTMAKAGGEELSDEQLEAASGGLIGLRMLKNSPAE
ncbi:MAG: Nif11-like leader peptide family RiPP precursor [Anaerovoracaceae bacterium]